MDGNTPSMMTTAHAPLETIAIGEEAAATGCFHGLKTQFTEVVLAISLLWPQVDKFKYQWWESAQMMTTIANGDNQLMPSRSCPTGDNCTWRGSSCNRLLWSLADWKLGASCIPPLTSSTSSTSSTCQWWESGQMLTASANDDKQHAPLETIPIGTTGNSCNSLFILSQYISVDQINRCKNSQVHYHSFEAGATVLLCYFAHHSNNFWYGQAPQHGFASFLLSTSTRVIV